MGVRGLQRPATHVQDNLGLEVVKVIHNKGEKPGHCVSCGKEMQKTQGGRFSPGPAHQPPGVPVQTRRCIVLFINIFGYQLFDY